MPKVSKQKDTAPPAPELPQIPAIYRTDSLIRKDLSISDLLPNEENPNEMSDPEFNMLYDNVERLGLTDPILVRPHPTLKGKFKIIGGHHRWEVAKLHGFEKVPVTVVTDPDFDDDMEKFQMVRHNVIHGKMSPKKFLALYQSLSGKYSEDLAAEMFGFADEEQFRKMINSTANALPPEMKQSFLDASKEIKTIDDLSVVLNRLFSTFGDTVPYGYMIFDFGGNDHVWIRMTKAQKKHVLALGQWCISKNRTLDKAMSVLMQLIAQGELSQGKFEETYLALPENTLAGGLTANDFPTEDYLAALDALDK